MGPLPSLLPMPISPTLPNRRTATSTTHRMLSSHYGGPVPTTAQAQSLVPSNALFQVLVGLDAPLADRREVRGKLKIEGENRSMLGEFGRWVLGIGLRESGF